MKKVTIYIEASDINMGTPDNQEYCPIAIALKRKFNTSAVSVQRCICHINGIKRILPKEAQQFVRKFDSDIESVQPFTFKINDVSPWRKE